MLTTELISALQNDKHIYFEQELPLLTLYDDNLFVRNDYDVLSVGQRNYLINLLKPFGFKQKSGKILTDGNVIIEFPKPNRILAISSYQPEFNEPSDSHFFVVTPSTYAETLFHRYQNDKNVMLSRIKHLIETCPFNIELIRDINYHSPIETITKETFSELEKFQSEIIEEKFKFKRSL
jgi:hypothetical protein